MSTRVELLFFLGFIYVWSTICGIAGGALKGYVFLISGSLQILGIVALSLFLIHLEIAWWEVALWIVGSVVIWVISTIIMLKSDVGDTIP